MSTAHELAADAPPRWATIAEAAGYAHTPERTLYRWVREGRLPATRLGRKYQVDLNEVDRLRRPARRETDPGDEALALEVAASLLPLAGWQRENLARLLLGKEDR